MGTYRLNIADEDDSSISFRESLLEFQGDDLVVCAQPVQGYKDVYQVTPVMNKEMFIKCYQKWILEKAEWIDECGHWICPKCGVEFSDLRSIDGKIQDNYCPSCGQHLNTLGPTASNF